MFRLASRAGLLVALLALALPVSGRADKDKPTKVEIAKRGKAATAFVEVPGRGTGTAFCIHPSGLFISNEHVVRGAEEVTLVMNPSLDTEKVLKAKVIRLDKDTDLALLRVDGAKDLPSLPLGSTDKLTELADVVACGFPLGKALSPDRKEYPAISVNTGTVTSLRMKGGQLQHIQIDVALTYGNSGGPVMDENGKVVGVVVSGVGGGKAGINQAIPVNHVEKFLKTPEVFFDGPDLTPTNLDKPHDFKARVASFVPNAPAPEVKIVVQAGDEKPREFPMKNVRGEWVASLVPVVKTGGQKVEITARVGNSSITGLIDDDTVTVAGKAVKLSAVKQINLGAKPGVVLTDGKMIDGEVGRLDEVVINFGGQKVKFDLSKATQIAVRLPDEIASVSATVVVTIDGKEVARVATQVGVRGAVGGQVGPGGPGSVVIKPPALTGDKITRQLPDSFSDAVVAGGGRYLVFQMPKLKKLAVFDVSVAKVTGYVPLAEEKAVFAAGLDCVIVGLPGAGRLERWSLTTFEREKNVSVAGEIRGLIMGHASTWAVVIDGVFHDPTTFKPLPLKYIWDRNAVGDRAWVAHEFPLYGSADGTVFGRWSSNQSPIECSTRVVEGNEVRVLRGGDLTHTIPGPNGRWVYTNRGVVTREMKHAHADDAKYGFCLPATSGDYFFALTSADDKSGGTFTIYHRGMKGPIGRLEKADHGLKFDNWGRDPWGPWRRAFFIPEAKVIAVLPESNDRVVLHKFDLDDALEKSGLDYLFVTSVPPRGVRAGATLTYPLAVKSKHGGLTYSVDSGPKEMTVSAAGVVTWAVPADATGEQDIILTVKDKTGQDVFHTFTLKVVK